MATPARDDQTPPCIPGQMAIDDLDEETPDETHD
ncbi:hypothetical protein SAMN05216275_14131 [Streptosporangium canum]|uniref:Uncharacterized protein n=1 Tax=Streptosporangium canum TaxID=324952 RepID=A0A1I4DEX3_9ACTN|nr:hypothetical protein SAMN05216275_14131 [Streptosporangium canum]